MKAPKRPITLVDIMDDYEAAGKKIVSLMVDHDGISDFYDSEDIEFVNPELFERMVHEYEITDYTKRKIGMHVVLQAVK